MDISLPFLFVIGTGNIAWAAYGIALGSLPIIIPNLVGITSLIVAISVTVQLRKKHRAQKASP